MRKKQRAAAEPTSPGHDAHETVLQLVQRFNADDWQGKKVYLYRVWPVIDKKSDDHFIAKLSEGFDEDYLLKNWGSGRYHLRLNDAQGHTLATQNVSIHNPAHAPKVDPAEVVESDPRNKTYFEIWGPRAAKPEPAGSAESAAVGELAKLAGKVLDQKTGASAPTNGLNEATTTLVLGLAQGRDTLAAKLAELAPGTDSLNSIDRAGGFENLTGWPFLAGTVKTSFPLDNIGRILRSPKGSNLLLDNPPSRHLTGLTEPNGVSRSAALRCALWPPTFGIAVRHTQIRRPRFGSSEQ